MLWGTWTRRFSLAYAVGRFGIGRAQAQRKFPLRKGLVKTALTLVAAALLASGCATTGGGNAQAAIDSTLASWKAGLEKLDIDSLMKNYSESFSSSRGDDKAAVKEFLLRAKEEGYLDGAKADLGNTKVSIEKDTATAAPIEISGDRGDMSISLTLKKEADKVWRIVGSEESN